MSAHPNHEKVLPSHGLDVQTVDHENERADLDSLTYLPNKTRSGRVVRQPDRYTDTSAMVALNERMGNEDSGIPTSYKEAMLGPDSTAWQSAMEEEISSIEDNKTWVLEARPKGFKAIGNRWVFAKKTNASGKLTCRRERLVSKGFPQRLVFEYN